ncbi:hypothetical protein ASC58_09270 [Phycicoccus sp. Root101]|nr:hypothetical protein ASC58_09270 [Phycicoccus sp. Root101]
MATSGAVRRPRAPHPASVVALVLAWWRTVVLVLWAAGWFAALAVHGGGSWHFFATGGRVLADLDDGTTAGLHVYAEHPLLQIGPVALGLAWALTQLSAGHGLLAAEALGTASGAAVVVLVHGIDGRLRRRRGTAARKGAEGPLLLATACFTPVWLYAAISSAHLDDVLALTFCVIALSCVLSDHPAWAGVAVAAAVDSKPWALPVTVVLLALPGLRSRAIGVGAAVVGVTAGWLPFFVADPQTIRAMHYTIVNRPLSGLHLLDPRAARTPFWDRPLQTAIGLVLGGVAVWRRRTTGVLLLVMASRLALDPGTNRYYTAGLAAGALLWDVAGSRRRWPWWSLTVVLALHLARWVPALDPLHGSAMIAFALAATYVILVGPLRAERPPTIPSGSAGAAPLHRWAMLTVTSGRAARSGGAGGGRTDLRSSRTAAAGWRL